jgi:natural product precursor
MKQKTIKKLKLNKTTVANLESKYLKAVKGGTATEGVICQPTSQCTGPVCTVTENPLVCNTEEGSTCDGYTCDCATVGGYTCETNCAYQTCATELSYCC